MPTATIRRSVVRGLAAVLLVTLAASSTVTQEPVVLHVVREPVASTPAAAQ